jgi:hypothetical protein
MPGSFSLIAGGNVTPSSFVKLQSGTDRSAILCGAGDRCFGISKEWHRFPAWEGLDDGNIAISGESLAVYALPEDSEGYLQLGGTVAVGDYLKSDASGHGVTAGSDGDEYGAQAMEAGNSGDVVKVALVRGLRGA